MHQCVHTELALHCARRSCTASTRPSELGVCGMRARHAPGRLAVRSPLVVAARRTAAQKVVTALLAPNERLPARPGGRGQLAYRGQRARSAAQTAGAHPHQCLRPRRPRPLRQRDRDLYQVPGERRGVSDCNQEGRRTLGKRQAYQSG